MRDQQDRQPVPRAWREEFDNIKPIRPIVYRKPTAKSEEPREKPEVKG
ncbi:MAG: hypothetical protein ACLQU2_16100 [Candidatus Binataceae bacterium]